MKTILILFLLLSFRVPAQAQNNSSLRLGVTPVTAIPNAARIEFSEQDACDLSSLYYHLDAVKITPNFYNIYQCTVIACVSALEPNTFLKSKYYHNNAFRMKDLNPLILSEADVVTFCEMNSDHAEGFETPDGSLFKCAPVIETDRYDLYKYTPIAVDKSRIRMNDRCHALQKCSEEAISPRQVAWAEWKSASLYCQTEPQTEPVTP
jgi:hypothetical protein